MDLLTNDFATLLTEKFEAPCLSLYQPTHRHTPDSLQDPIRFENLVRDLENLLRQDYGSRDVNALLEPFKQHFKRPEFWMHTLDGLAMFAANGFFRVFHLPRSVPELAIVAKSFHTKPLLRIVQSADRYQVLGINRQGVRLFEGNRDQLSEVPLADEVPKSLEEALGTELTEPHLTVASYGTGTEGAAMFHGHGGRKPEVKKDAERFFRIMDRAILDHHSRPSGLPLILAALPENQDLFRKVSKNPFLLADPIDVHPDAIKIEDLRERSWKIFGPRYLKRLEGMVEGYGEAQSKGLGEKDIYKLGHAAVEGRIKTLLVEADRQIFGHIDEATGQIIPAETDQAVVDDVLDDLAQIVIRRGGEAIIVPSDRMPTASGAAAIYRF